MKPNHLALFILLATLSLSACGNKGPLVSAQRPVPVDEAMPPAESPVPTNPADPAPMEQIAPPANAKPASSTPA